jgi:hypothetical protein
MYCLHVSPSHPPGHRSRPGRLTCLPSGCLRAVHSPRSCVRLNKVEALRSLTFLSSLSVVSIHDWWSVIPDLCFSTFGIAFFLIFGSQKGILRLWRRWFLPCTLPREEQTQDPAARQQTSFGSAEIDKWRIPQKEGESETTESWQDLEDARYYENYIRRGGSADGSHTDHRVLTAGRAAGRGMTIEEEDVDAYLELHYVHTRESSNEADPEGNPFSSASTVSRFSSLPPAPMLSPEHRSGPPSGAMASPNSVVDEFSPTFKLHHIPPPPPSYSTFEIPQSQPGTPTLIVSPPPLDSPLSISRQPFRPNLWSTDRQPSHDPSTARPSQIGMAM